MKWLEKMADQGIIRQEVYKDILRDVDSIKTATGGPQPQAAGPNPMLMPLLMGLMTLGPAVVNSIGGAISEANKHSSLINNIRKSKETIIGNYTPEDRAKASARFEEIAKIAPSVASNPTLASKLVAENLHSGISSEQAQKLSMLQSQHSMSKTGSLGEIRPEVMGDIVADIFIIKQAALEKLGAGKGTFLRDVAVISSVPLIVNTIGGAVNWVNSKMKERDLNKSLSSAYKDALKGSTSNAELLRSSPDAAQNAFKTLVHFAPHIATNPTAARGFMAKIVEYGQGGLDVSELKGLTEVQKNMLGAQKPNAFAEGFTSASDVFGMKRLMPDSLRDRVKGIAHEMDRD